MEKLKVGQTVWILKVGNAVPRRYDEKRNSVPIPLEELIEERVITKVGRVWITTETKGQYRFEDKFSLETMSNDTDKWCATYCYYLTKEEIIAEQTRNRYLRKIKNSMDRITIKGLTPEKLEQVAELLGIDLKE